MRDTRDDNRMGWRDDDRDLDQGGYGSGMGQGSYGYGQGSYGYGRGGYGQSAYGRDPHLGYGHDYQGTYGQGSQGTYGRGDYGRGDYGRGDYGGSEFGGGYQAGYGRGGYGQGSYGQGTYGQAGYGRRGWQGRGSEHDQGRWGRSDWHGADWRSGEPPNMGQADQSTSYTGLTNDWDQRGRFAGRGPKGYRRSDERIREDVSDRLTDDTWLDASNIEVKVESGMVTLTGDVDSRDDKRRAEDIAMSCSGVKDVINQIHVDQGILGQVGDALSDDRSKTADTVTGRTR